MMGYEGHPVLWHMLIWPMAHLGLPFISQNFFALAIMGVAVWLLLFKADLPFVLKVAFVFSPLMTYFFPVIARSYSLIPPILFFIATFYKTRKTHPYRYMICISLLVHTHAIMIIVAFLLSLFFLIEIIVDCKRDWKTFIQRSIPLLLPLVSAVLLGLGLFCTGKSSYVAVDEISLLITKDKVLSSINLFLYIFFGRSYSGTIKYIFIALCLLAIFFFVKSKEGLKAMLLVGVSTAFVIYFSSVVISLYHIQQWASLIYLILVCMWIVWKTDKKCVFSTIVNAVVVIVFITGIAIVTRVKSAEIYYDYYEYFSAGKETGEYINSNIEPEAVFISDNEAYVSAVLPYISNKVISVSSGEEYTFTVWDEDYKRAVSYEQFEDVVATVDTKPVYLLSAYLATLIDDYEKISEEYELIYESPSAMGGTLEEYRIYKLTP